MESDHSDGHTHGTAENTHMESMSKMPGMASSEDMAALRQATGPAVDVLYLQLMLRHHQGGLPMMEYAAQHASEDAVRSLAQTMVDTQQSEATVMTNMLTAKAPLPADELTSGVTTTSSRAPRACPRGARDVFAVPFELPEAEVGQLRGTGRFAPRAAQRGEGEVVAAHPV